MNAIEILTVHSSCLLFPPSFHLSFFSFISSLSPPNLFHFPPLLFHLSIPSFISSPFFSHHSPPFSYFLLLVPTFSFFGDFFLILPPSLRFLLLLFLPISSSSPTLLLHFFPLSVQTMDFLCTVSVLKILIFTASHLYINPIHPDDSTAGNTCC